MASCPCESHAAIEAAAAHLLSASRVFTQKNLFYAVRRALSTIGATCRHDWPAFCAGPLARQLRGRPLPGLLPPASPGRRRRIPAEWDAYFPAAILLVDRPELVNLIAASGALVQARIAPVAIDGTPAHVVRWLVNGFRRGQRAPIAYVHDAATRIYPFLYQPLTTLIELTQGEPLPYRDLGLPPAGLPASAFPFTAGLSPDEQIDELEQLPPAACVAYAVRGALSLVPPDPLLAPIKPASRRKR